MNNRPIKNLGEKIGRIINKIVDFLLPKEQKVKLLEALGPDGLYENIPRAENFDLPEQAGFDTTKIKSIFNYRTSLCRQAIWEIKYRANKKLITDFSLLLYEYILEELTDLENFNNFRNIILLPIPATTKRTKEKGFNQCVLICRELIKIDQERNGNNFTLHENFLQKVKETPHQARVSNRASRLKNLIGVFSINKKTCGILSPLNGVPNRSESIPQAFSTNRSKSVAPTRLSDHSFIIIDDVITTGATMHEAFRTLKKIGIPPRKIRGFALAH